MIKNIKYYGESDLLKNERYSRMFHHARHESKFVFKLSYDFFKYGYFDVAGGFVDIGFYRIPILLYYPIHEVTVDNKLDAFDTRNCVDIFTAEYTYNMAAICIGGYLWDNFDRTYMTNMLYWYACHTIFPVVFGFTDNNDKFVVESIGPNTFLETINAYRKFIMEFCLEMHNNKYSDYDEFDFDDFSCIASLDPDRIKYIKSFSMKERTEWDVHISEFERKFRVDKYY